MGNSEIALEFPLSVDIRVSTKCSFGQRDDGTYVLCSYCHESAKVNGEDCNYSKLFTKLLELPPGTELAIGCNEITPSLRIMLHAMSNKGYICNITVNQGHLGRDLDLINQLRNNKYIRGLGISYRNTLPFKIPPALLDYSNTVIHVIAGIDTVDDVLSLADKGVKKILILGEKDFGFNKGKVDNSDLDSWRWRLPQIVKAFTLVSFDNLAIQQLQVKRLFVEDSKYDLFNQQEHSIYINAVEEYFSPSSRSSAKWNWDLVSIKDYFSRAKKIKGELNVF